MPEAAISRQNFGPFSRNFPGRKAIRDPWGRRKKEDEVLARGRGITVCTFFFYLSRPLSTNGAPSQANSSIISFWKSQDFRIISSNTMTCPAPPLQEENGFMTEMYQRKTDNKTRAPVGSNLPVPGCRRYWL